jgi:putative ABC transport system permease protein
MAFRDLLRDTLWTLSAHKLRTFLSMFGIAWGIVSITLMVAAGEGLSVGFERVKENFGRDVMIIFAGRTSLQAGGARAGRLIRWNATDALAVEQQAPSCKYVMPELSRDLPVHSAYNSGTILVAGSYPAFAEIRTIRVEEGRFYSEEDQQRGRRVAVLGSDAKKQLFATRSALYATISIGGYPYTVVGVMRPKDQDSSYDEFDVRKVFIPFNSILRDFPEKPPALPESIDRLLAAPRSLEAHEACKAEIRRALARIHNFDPQDREAASVWDTVEEGKAFRMLTDGMKYFLGAIGLATLFLGGIGVMNVMLVAVRERTREIGVRKAVGASARTILRQFFVESLIVVLISGGSGLGIAYGFCALVNMLPMPAYFAGLLPTWGSALLSFALLGTVAILAALYPARRAATIDPIEALRYEPGG